MHFDILVKDCTLMLPEIDFAHHMSIGIKDGLIAKIAPAAQMEDDTADQSLDGRGKAMLPGLVDGHTHTCQQLLRGRTADEYPMIWTRFLVPFESNLTPEESYISAQLCCLEMIKNGTTSFADAGGVHMDHVAEAVIESGMRGVLTNSTMDMGNAIVGAMKATTEECVKNTQKLYADYHGKGDGRVEVFFGMRQVMTCSPTLIQDTAAAAKELNTGIHAHLCEHRDEVSFCLQNYGMRPAEFLGEMGMLGPNLLTAHNVALSEHDITLMAQNDVKVIHCPIANLTNHGFPKTPRLLEAGLSIGLGCDGASRHNLNLFDEMKALRVGTIAYWGLPVFDPVVLRAQQVLKMATFGGANAIGHGHDLGCVEVGKKADVILVNINQPHLWPNQNLAATLSDCADGHDVTDSIIAGKLVMKDRKVLTLDEEKILSEAHTAMNNIVARVY